MKKKNTFLSAMLVDTYGSFLINIMYLTANIIAHDDAFGSFIVYGVSLLQIWIFAIICLFVNILMKQGSNRYRIKMVAFFIIQCVSPGIAINLAIEQKFLMFPIVIAVIIYLLGTIIYRNLLRKNELINLNYRQLRNKVMEKKNTFLSAMLIDVFGLFIVNTVCLTLAVLIGQNIVSAFAWGMSLLQIWIFVIISVLVNILVKRGLKRYKIKLFAFVVTQIGVPGILFWAATERIKLDILLIAFLVATIAYLLGIMVYRNLLRRNELNGEN
jgi:hypothetical protein